MTAKMMRVKIHNLILFITMALWHGTPFHLWGIAWKQCKADHLAEVRKAVWELKCKGMVREDKDGYLFSTRENDDE